MKTITDQTTKGHRMPRFLAIAALAAVVSLQSACIHQSDRQISPSYSASRISKLRSVYVRSHPDDDYKLAETIAGEFQKQGFTASSGSAQSSPRKVDAVVTYMDRWVWDMTMYMLSLDVQLREPGSDVILAKAKTVRSSLIRKSQEEMARETVSKLLGKE